MDILGYKSGGHDGVLCYVQDGRLIFNIEAEKDSGHRHALFTREEVAEVVARWQCQPHVICGDSREFGGKTPDNYIGTERKDILKVPLSDAAGAEYLSIPHEMAHIACSYALSDLPEKQPFYALVWEGYIGRFYRVDADFNITRLGDTDHVMTHVGVRYSFPYHATGRSDIYGHAAAGKIMALAGLADASRVAAEHVQRSVDRMLDGDIKYENGTIALDGDWDVLYRMFEAFRDVPVTDPEFVAICKALQDAVFERFYRFAKDNMKEKLPLLISGGCGLNCDWNTMWRDTGLFESVFVPPVTNDSGIAIGAAAVVQHMHTGHMKLDWNVYVGEEFIDEPVNFPAAGFTEMHLDYNVLTDWLLKHDMVVAWIQGRYEMGPRALCHRSLIAAPFRKATQNELNRIKQREPFRPVAPVCMEEEVSRYFEWTGPSPYMLYFQKVKSPRLEAITHADGTARVQTINRQQDAMTYQLLRTFRDKSDYGVLCNTSLNFLGCGFINRTSHIVQYVKETAIPAFVINNKMYLSIEKQQQINGR